MANRDDWRDRATPDDETRYGDHREVGDAGSLSRSGYPATGPGGAGYGGPMYGGGSRGSSRMGYYGGGGEGGSYSSGGWSGAGYGGGYYGYFRDVEEGAQSPRSGGGTPQTMYFESGAAGAAPRGDRAVDPPGRQAGPHAGRGPRGYTRRDERILEDACDALLRDGEVDASDVEVSVKGGEVTLAGTVSDRRTKRRAEEVVERVRGVADVHNRLRLARADADDADGDRA